MLDGEIPETLGRLVDLGKLKMFGAMLSSRLARQANKFLLYT